MFLLKSPHYEEFLIAMLLSYHIVYLLFFCFNLILCCVLCFLHMLFRDKRLFPEVFNVTGITNPDHGFLSDCPQRSPFHHIDSHTAQTVTLTLDFSSHNPFHSDYAHGCSQSHTLHKPWTSSFSLPSIVCAYHSPSDSYITDPLRASLVFPVLVHSLV